LKANCIIPKSAGGNKDLGDSEPKLLSEALLHSDWQHDNALMP